MVPLKFYILDKCLSNAQITRWAHCQCQVALFSLSEVTGPVGYHLMRRSLSVLFTQCTKTFHKLNTSGVKVLRYQRSLLPQTLTCYSAHFCSEESTRRVEMADNRFSADYAKLGTSSCKKCKQKIGKGEFRIAKVPIKAVVTFSIVYLLFCPTSKLV